MPGLRPNGQSAEPYTKEKKLAAVRRYKAKLKAKGICQHYRERKAAEGHVLCTPCLLGNRLRGQIRTRKLREASGSTRKGCEICGRNDQTLALDHCHSSNQFRGWLCSRCNLGLGHFQDNPDRLRSAIAYLERFTQHQAQTRDSE